MNNELTPVLVQLNGAALLAIFRQKPIYIRPERTIIEETMLKEFLQDGSEFCSDPKKPRVRRWALHSDFYSFPDSDDDTYDDDLDEDYDYTVDPDFYPARTSSATHPAAPSAIHPVVPPLPNLLPASTPRVVLGAFSSI